MTIPDKLAYLNKRKYIRRHYPLYRLIISGGSEKVEHHYLCVNYHSTKQGNQEKNKNGSQDVQYT